MEIFRLFGSILVDSSEADKSIKKTGDNAKSLSSKIGAGLKTVGKAAAGIATAAAGAATAAGAALKSAVDDTAAYADTIDKASYRSGLGAENLQRLKYAAEQSGASLENIEKSAKKMNDRLAEVSEGNEKSAEMFEKLGVAVYDADGNMRSSDDVYNDVLAKLADMGDTAEATAIGTDLFGKAFTDLKPLLAAGSDGINDLKDNADALGIVMSQDAVTAGVKYGDTVADIKNALGGAARSIGASVLPMFQKFADKLITYIPKIQDFIKKIIPIVEKLADSIIDPLMEMIDELFPPLMDFVESLIEPVSDIISAIIPVIIDLLKKLLPIITDIIKELLPPLLDILDDLMPLFDVALELLDPILDLVKGLITPVGKVLKAIEPFVDTLIKIIEKGMEPLQGLFEKMAPFLDEVLGRAFELVCDTLNNVLLPAFEGVLKFLSGDFLGGIDSWGNSFTGLLGNIFSGIDSIFGTHLAEWYDGFNDFFMEVGSRLYEMNHQGDIEMADLTTKYAGMYDELNQATLKAIRGGATAEEAMEQAKKEVLDTSEKLYFYDRMMEESQNKNSNWGWGYSLDYVSELYALNKEAQARNNTTGISDSSWYGQYYGGAGVKTYKKSTQASSSSWYGEYYKSGAGLPKLASGGLAYDDTLALIGDNPDARVNPEVVAPLSELSAINAKALDSAAEKIAALIGAQIQKQPISIEIVTRLSDDTELTRSIIKNINECTRQDGVCVIKGI